MATKAKSQLWEISIKIKDKDRDRDNETVKGRNMDRKTEKRVWHAVATAGGRGEGGVCCLLQLRLVSVVVALKFTLLLL